MPDAPTDLTGRTLGDFHLLRKLGQGGMGQVYLARQQSLKREVALKLLRGDLADDPVALKRFQAEAEAVARISHPNIVQVYAVGEADGLRYMALEYVRGRTLRDVLLRKGPPDLPVAMAVIRQVAAALQRAAEAGIVHRDVKPENILVTRQAEVKVTDFGLSRLTTADDQPLHLTQTGVTVGTPLYMAPEQVQGKAIDHRTDLYALGATVYHLLSGQPPFGGTTAYDVAMKHVTEPPPPLAAVRPDLPADLCALTHKLLAKDPAARPQTAKDVLRDLARVREGITAGQAGMSQPMLSMSVTAPALPVSRSAWPARVLAGLGVVACGVGGFAGHRLLHPPTPAAMTWPGLPDARPPAPVRSAREGQLLALVDKASTQPKDVADGYLELALMYVRERRLDAADEMVTKLDAVRLGGRPPKGPLGPDRNRAAAAFARGVVLAHRDKAAESADVLRDAVKLFAPRKENGAVLVRVFLLDHIDLAEAVSEAAHRDAVNLRAEGKPVPAELDALRSPATDGR